MKADVVKESSNNRGSWGKIRQCLHIAAEVSELAVHIKTKPGPFMWAALALKLSDMSLRIYDELIHSGLVNAWDYFGLNAKSEEWIVLPRYTYKLFYSVINDKKMMTKSTDPTCNLAWRGMIANKFEIGYIAQLDIKDSGMKVALVKSDHYAEFIEWLGDRMWDTIPNGHAKFTSSGLESDKIDTKNLFETNLLIELDELVDAFLKIGEPRSYLIYGEPGTGKSTAIKKLANRDKLKSIRIPIKEIYQPHLDLYNPYDPDALKLEMLIALTKPDVLILDDIDRLTKKEQTIMLDFLEDIRDHVKLFIASANHVENLDPAIRRVERFDEIFEVPKLSQDIIEQILGPKEKKMANKMSEWPIAYIVDYTKRVNAHGSKKARKQIDDLQSRVKIARDWQNSDKNSSMLLDHFLNN